jgi:hypothetical protein
MTLTFKDSDGVEWQLESWPCFVLGRREVPQLYKRLATLNDLARAGFVRLATGSDGPTDAELEAVEVANLLPDSVARRALCNAGRASREAAILAALSEAFGEREQPFMSLEQVRETVRGFMVALREVTNERDAFRSGVSLAEKTITALESELARLRSKTTGGV